MNFVKLCHVVSDDGYEYVEEVYFQENWLAAHVKQSLPEFFVDYTSEDVEMLMGDAILANAIPFTFCVDRDKPFEFYSMDEDAVLQFIDCVSEALNEKHPEASKAIDAAFEL